MPYQSSLPDTLIVDGTDLQTLTGVYLDDLAFLLAPGTRRGEQTPIPGEDGAGGTDAAQRGAELPIDQYTFTVPIEIRGVDSSEAAPATEIGARGQFLANVKALADAIQGTNGKVILTRRMTNAAGTGYDTDTADGQFVTGLTPDEQITAVRARFSLQFTNLSGRWKRGSTWIVP